MPTPRTGWLLLGDSIRFSIQALASNKLRTFLTALGLVIGNASVILVVTVSLTSRDYVLRQINAIGSNIIYAYFDPGNRDAHTVAGDFVKIADVEAIREELGSRIRAASGVMFIFESVRTDGLPRDILVLGADDQYAVVRNLVQVRGRGLSPSDVILRQRVAVITERLAIRLYGSQEAAIGEVLKIRDLQFSVIGTFREKTESFGLSELSKDTIVIPITVFKYLAPYERIDPLYVQASSADDVDAVTSQVRQILESRHRPGARYFVGNLSTILDAAKNISVILTVVLLLVAAITLVISGVGIMNIMLVTVTERTREIGLRLAVGATRKVVLQQFLMEAVIISAAGGMIGAALGVAVSLVAQRSIENLSVPISWISVVCAFGVSFVVGLVFGLLPANRAARLDPTEALRHE